MFVTPEQYERWLVPALFAGWARTLIELIGPSPGRRALDVACGTGVVARLVTSKLDPMARVAGVDADPSMLAVARECAGFPNGSITWVLGDAHQLPFSDGSFDAVLCQQGLQFFADPTTAIREMGRVLVPNGRLAVSVWRGVRDGAWASALAAAFTTVGDGEAADALATPCLLSEDYELRQLLQAAGFRDVETAVSVECLSSSSSAEMLEQAAALTTLGVPLSRLQGHARRALLTSLEEQLKPLLRVGRYAVPIEANVAVASR